MSVKGPANTFDINPEWQRTLPSCGIYEGGFAYTLKYYRRKAKFFTTWV
jgi:hypothetical protein